MREIKSLSVGCFAFGLFYLFGSFNNANFDISKWTEFSRYCISSIGAFTFFLCGILFYFKDKL